MADVAFGFGNTAYARRLSPADPCMYTSVSEDERSSSIKPQRQMRTGRMTTVVDPNVTSRLSHIFCIAADFTSLRLEAHGSNCAVYFAQMFPYYVQLIVNHNERADSNDFSHTSSARHPDSSRSRRLHMLFIRLITCNLTQPFARLISSARAQLSSCTPTTLFHSISVPTTCPRATPDSNRATRHSQPHIH